MSGPISTSGPIHADDGSISVTPDAITASLRASRTCAFMIASSARLLTPRSSSASAMVNVSTRRPSARKMPEQVGEVVLALVVRRADPAQRVEEPVQRERVDAAVELGERLLGGRRVALLDDPGEPPVLPHDAAQAGRVGQVRGQDRGGGAGRLMVRQQPGGWTRADSIGTSP